MKKEGVRTFFKLLQNKINEYSAKRYKKDERSSSQYKELWATVGIGKLSDEIRCPIDEIDKNQLEILTHIIIDFKIIASIRFYGHDADPNGNVNS